MSSYDPKARLKEYHITLKHVLGDVQDSLWLKLGVNELKRSSETTSLAKNEQELQVLQTSIKEIKERLEFLRTPNVLVEQEIEGNSHTHTQKGLRPTPNFHFNLSTQFPIRNHETFESEGCVWKTKLCPEGGKTFVGEVKTKPFKDANVTVLFYGWRNEMSALEINHLEDTLATLESLRVGFETDLKTSKDVMKKLAGERSRLESKRDECIKDLAVIEKSDPAKDIPQDILEILEVKSISQLALHYKLLTRVNKIEDQAPAMSDATIRLFSTSENEIKNAWTALISMRNRYLDFSQATQKSSREFLGELESLSLNGTTLASLQTSKTAVANKKGCRNHKVEALCKSASADLEVLELDLQSVVTDLESEAMKAEKTAEAERDAKRRKIEVALKDFIDLTKNEEHARADAVEAVSRDMRHVGVIAALRTMSTTSDAWMSVYRGARAGIIHAV
jgi:hypothetical protein